MKSCFQVKATKEQIEYTNKIVEYSIEHHKVSNIWDKSKYRKNNTSFYRFIGSLGEVVFADVYGIPRHTRSFGAVDGQDYGDDFEIEINGAKTIVDLKSMHRKNDKFYGNYVLNIPSIQVHKMKSLTDVYFCISINKRNNDYFISFLGIISKKEILDGKTGILYKRGTKRIRGNDTYFTFIDDTYEIDFKDFEPPFITPRMQKINGFKLIEIKDKQ